MKPAPTSATRVGRPPGAAEGAAGAGSGVWLVSAVTTEWAPGSAGDCVEVTEGGGGLGEADILVGGAGRGEAPPRPSLLRFAEGSR